MQPEAKQTSSSAWHAYTFHFEGHFSLDPLPSNTEILRVYSSTSWKTKFHQKLQWNPVFHNKWKVKLYEVQFSTKFMENVISTHSSKLQLFFHGICGMWKIIFHFSFDKLMKLHFPQIIMYGDRYIDSVVAFSVNPNLM